MTQDRRVIVGLADDERSDSAVAAGAALASALAVPISVLHAVRPPWNPWVRMHRVHLAAANGLSLAGAWRRHSQRVTNLLTDTGRAQSTADGALQIRAGQPQQVLLDASQEHLASAIVLGPHRRRSVLDFGRTARSVLALSRVPVWVQAVQPRTIRRIICAVDLEETSANTLSCALRMAQAFDAELRVEHCFQGCSPPGAARIAAELDRLVDEISAHSNISVGRAVIDRPAAPHFLDAGERAELVVAGTHGGTRLSGSVLGTVAYALLRSAPVATLAVPAGYEAHAAEQTAAAADTTGGSRADR